MSDTKWIVKTGATLHYWVLETAAGRTRISRVNKHGVPAFRAYFPDGKNFTASTPENAKDAAERYLGLTP